MRELFLISLAVSALGADYFRTAGGGMVDPGTNMAKTADGGYILTGYTGSYGAGSVDILLIKTDSDGHIQWSRTIGGTAQDYGTSVIQTSDGGYAVAGLTYSYGAGSYDLILVKTNSSGALEWARVIGGANYDQAHTVIQTQDGGLLLAGETQSYGSGPSDFILVKFAGNGTYQWARAVGGTSVDEAFWMAPCSDGGYILGGRSGSYGSGFLLVKFLSNDNLDWARVVAGGYYYSFLTAATIIQANDGGFAMTMTSWSYGAGTDDILMVKLSSAGALEWARAAGVPNNDLGFGLVQTPDTGYVISGETEEYNTGPTEIVLLKYDKQGNFLWARQFDRDGTYDMGSSVALAADGDIVFLGSYANDLALGEFKQDGTNCLATEWSPTITAISPSVTSCAPGITSISPTVSAITPAVSVQSVPQTTICEVLGTDESAGQGPSLAISRGGVSFVLPADSRVRLSVYDPAGRLIATPVNGWTEAGEHRVSLEGLAAGIYMVELAVDGRRTVGKAIIR